EGALLDLAVVAIGLDDADILVDRAAGRPDFDASEVHVVKYHDGPDGNQGKNRGDLKRKLGMMSLRYPGEPGGGIKKNPEEIAEFERAATARRTHPPQT